MTSQESTAARRGRQVAGRRRDRERELLRVTRELFDARGVRDVQIEDVARAAGLNRAIIYRHYSGKEELFALVIVLYVEEFEGDVARLADEGTSAERLAAFADLFLSFCLRYPAFIDCAMTMLQQPGAELLERMGERAMLRMGGAVASALRRPVELLREGDAAGEFTVADPDYVANAMYVQILGLAHLARVGNAIRELPGGAPWFFPVDGEGIRASVRGLVQAALRPPAPA